MNPRRWARPLAVGEAEIENLHASIARDEQILRLQVAMDDPRSCAAASPRAIWMA